MLSLSTILQKSAMVIATACIAVVMPCLAEDVGKVAAVNPDSTGNGQVVELGASVIHNERIQTNSKGSLQVLFIDRTTLSVGPNSNLVIDNYVFDPHKNAGKMTVSLGKGLMRFVGGQITHAGEATVNTPPATIGIRGGVADVTTDGKTTRVSNYFGSVTITPKLGPGSNVPVPVPQGSTGATAFGAPPSVTLTTQQQANDNNRQFQSKPGQTGGAPPGTSSTAALISNHNGGITASITPYSSPTRGSTAPGPSSCAAFMGDGATDPTSACSSFSSGSPTSVTTSTQSVHTTSSNTATQNSPPPPPPPPAPPPGPPLYPPP
jgi:hypothetical protein